MKHSFDCLIKLLTKFSEKIEKKVGLIYESVLSHACPNLTSLCLGIDFLCVFIMNTMGLTSNRSHTRQCFITVQTGKVSYNSCEMTSHRLSVVKFETKISRYQSKIKHYRKSQDYILNLGFLYETSVVQTARSVLKKRSRVF